MVFSLKIRGIGIPSARWDPLWVFLLCAFCFGWALGVAPLAGTEGFRALTATQMLDSGDWLLPRLYGQLYLRKPPMMYWVLAGAEMLAGRANEWVWRLPSALGAALLGAFLCQTAKRWWGRAAGLTTGVAFLSLGALWSQFRSADIDALNTFFAFITVIALLELARGETLRKWMWSLLGGIAMGATLLLKGPAALPLILAALLAPALLNDVRKLRSAYIWAIPAIGALIFAAYALAVVGAVEALDNPAATSGLREAGDKMMITSWGELGESLLLPPQLLLFGMPPALSLVVLLRRSTLRSMDEKTLCMFKSLVGTFVIAAAIGLVTGMHNPRYAYILLPLFALLAGLLAGEIATDRLDTRAHRLVNKQIFGLTLLLGLAGSGLAVYLWLENANLAAAIPLVLGISSVWVAVNAWRNSRLAALYIAAIIAIVSCALAFDYIKNAERTRRSGRLAGEEMRAVTGEDVEVTTGLMIWTHPEIFHYAGVEVRAHSRWQFAEPVELEEDGWVLFHPREWKVWQARWPSRFSAIVELPTHVKGAVLAWYSVSDDGVLNKEIDHEGFDD